MRYKVALRKTEEGYSVSVPGLPGCWSQGDTEEEAIDNIREAIREYLAVAEELAGDATVKEWEGSPKTLDSVKKSFGSCSSSMPSIGWSVGQQSGESC